MSQQSVPGGAASALDAQAVRRKEHADRERRLGRLAVAVLAALGERDAERRAGEELQRMTDDKDYRCANRSTGAAAASPCET